MDLPKIVIIECGSQYTLIIGRALRELGVRSVILDPKKALAFVNNNPVKGIIISGSGKSVYDEDVPALSAKLLSWRSENGELIPVLGICYGMQWIVKELGGNVEQVSKNREYSEVKVHVNTLCKLFENTPPEQIVWASHGDSITSLPEKFRVTSKSLTTGAIAAIESDDHKILGVQFHPEVDNTAFGKVILRNFVFTFCQCEPDWLPEDIIFNVREKTLLELQTGKVVMGFSGGVDSTTVAAILSPILQENLLGIVINGGNLRENELEEIRRHGRYAGITIKIIRAKSEFQEALTGITNAEEKRQCFKKLYTAILTREAEKVIGVKAIIQGTLAPDKIESGATGGDMIKSHHNVGNVFGGFDQIHPIDNLFKYEVRALAQELGLPESVWGRQPFPGPGLFLRVVGATPTPELLEIVREADVLVREILEKYNLYSKISQLVVAYMALPTVGVMGDKRVYGGFIAVRAVKTIDFMTAEGVIFPADVQREIISVVTSRLKLSRVMFDSTNKPPATTEFE